MKILHNNIQIQDLQLLLHLSNGAMVIELLLHLLLLFTQRLDVFLFPAVRLVLDAAKAALHGARDFDDRSVEADSLGNVLLETEPLRLLLSVANNGISAGMHHSFLQTVLAT